MPPTAVVEAEAVVIRTLGPEEYSKLEGIGLFNIFNLPNMEHCIPVVAEKQPSGKIVAYWLVFDAVHVEPLWIDEEHRNKPGLARRLWKTVQDVLVAKQVPVAFACIGSGDMAANLPMATRLGFKKLQADLFFIEVKPAPEAGGE